jgi:hypothetical protein
MLRRLILAAALVLAALPVHSKSYAEYRELVDYLQKLLPMDTGESTIVEVSLSGQYLLVGSRVKTAPTSSFWERMKDPVKLDAFKRSELVAICTNPESWMRQALVDGFTITMRLYDAAGVLRLTLPPTTAKDCAR